MTLSSSTSRRALRHTRTLSIQSFVRDDGLWEIDARITDIKPYDLSLQAKQLPAGEPLHDLWLRVVFNDDFVIVDVQAASDSAPYDQYCVAAEPAYRRLIGLNLLRGFRQSVRERLGGVQGCTHLTELAQQLPTVAIQTMANAPELRNRSGASTSTTTKAVSADGRPFQIDGCQALRADGDAVALFYPRWANGSAAVDDSGSGPAPEGVAPNR